MAMTSMAQDLHDERQKAHPSFSLESCLLAPLRGLPACRDAASPSISPCLIFCRAASGHSQARSSAVTCPCVVVSAHTICRSSAPPATASQDTYRAVAIALSKNRQTAFSSLLIDTAPLGCPRPCILAATPICPDGGSACAVIILLVLTLYAERVARRGIASISNILCSLWAVRRWARIEFDSNKSFVWSSP